MVSLNDLTPGRRYKAIDACAIDTDLRTSSSSAPWPVVVNEGQFVHVQDIQSNAPVFKFRMGSGGDAVGKIPTWQSCIGKENDPTVSEIRARQLAEAMARQAALAQTPKPEKSTKTKPHGLTEVQERGLASLFEEPTTPSSPTVAPVSRPSPTSSPPNQPVSRPSAPSSRSSSSSRSRPVSDVYVPLTSPIVPNITSNMTNEEIASERLRASLAETYRLERENRRRARWEAARRQQQ